MVSFGYSVGDIVALGSFAWNIYKSCKDAPESFAGVRQETLSLHAVLKEIEEALGECQLQSSQQERLQTICDGCKSVLEDLSALIQKYQSLGAQSQRTWDRLRWGKEDVDSLRNRLTSNVVLLSSFLQNTHVVLERKLRKLLAEFHNGHRETSIFSLDTIDSLSADEHRDWRGVRKCLQEVGITPEIFNANKTFITGFLKGAAVSGAFSESSSMIDTSSVVSQPLLGQARQLPNLHTRTADRSFRTFDFLKLPLSLRIQQYTTWRKPFRRWHVLPTKAHEGQKTGQFSISLSDQAVYSKDCNIVLLGDSASGKTTILKQFLLSYSDAPFKNDLMEWTNILWSNVIETLQQLPDEEVCRNVKTDHGTIVAFEPNTKNCQSAATFQELVHLWQKPYFQKVLAMLNESPGLDYISKNIHRIGDVDSAPSESDILRARVRTLGVSKTSLVWKGQKLNIFDCGGECPERKKWMHPLRMANCVLFVIGLDDLSHDLSTNEKFDALWLLKSIMGSMTNEHLDERACIIVILNRQDIFRKMLESDTSRTLFPGKEGEVTGDARYRQSLDIIVQKFRFLPRTRCALHLHVTNACDTKSTRACLDEILAHNRRKMEDTDGRPCTWDLVEKAGCCDLSDFI